MWTGKSCNRPSNSRLMGSTEMGRANSQESNLGSPIRLSASCQANLPQQSLYTQDTLPLHAWGSKRHEVWQRKLRECKKCLLGLGDRSCNSCCKRFHVLIAIFAFYCQLGAGTELVYCRLQILRWPNIIIIIMWLFTKKMNNHNSSSNINSNSDSNSISNHTHSISNSNIKINN